MVRSTNSNVFHSAVTSQMMINSAMTSPTGVGSSNLKMMTPAEEAQQSFKMKKNALLHIMQARKMVRKKVPI